MALVAVSEVSNFTGAGVLVVALIAELVIRPGVGATVFFMLVAMLVPFKIYLAASKMLLTSYGFLDW